MIFKKMPSLNENNVELFRPFAGITFEEFSYS